MWLDVRAKLAEIEGTPTATTATTATNWANPARRVAEVAEVATPPRVKSEIAPPARAVGLDPDAFPYGTACNLGDAPRTWTGRIVSLDEWLRLTEWEKHGPNGRHWCGLCRCWHVQGPCNRVSK
jgi:hypothetical protein